MAILAQAILAQAIAAGSVACRAWGFVGGGVPRWRLCVVTVAAPQVQDVEIVMEQLFPAAQTFEMPKQGPAPEDRVEVQTAEKQAKVSAAPTCGMLRSPNG